MPATLSKDEEIAEQKKKWSFRVLCLGGLLNMAAFDSTVTVRPELLKSALGNDPTLIGRTTANWLAAGSAIQLLVAPWLAKFSDSYGRKPALTFGAVVSLVLRILVLRKPSYTNLALEKIVPTAVCYYVQFAISNAAFADLTKTTEEQAVGFGKYMSSVGIGVLLSPIVASQVVSRTKPIHAYSVCIAFNVALVGLFVAFLEETLPKESRKPFTFAGTNPLAFTRLFTKSAVIRKFASLYATMQFMQGTQLSDILLVYMGNDCGFSQQMQNYSIVAYGTTMMIAGQLVKRSVATFGELGHTSASLFVSVIGFVLWSVPKTWTHFVGLFIQGLGYERLSTCLAAGVRHCAREGMGKAEAAAAFTNMRGFTAIVIPLFYARVYAFGRKKGFPGLPFAFAACTAVVAEMINRSLGTKAYKIETAS